MKLGNFKSAEEAAEALMGVTNGHQHALGSILELASLEEMDLKKAIDFVKERGVPSDKTEIIGWWRENMNKIRGQVIMKGGEFGE